MFTRRFLSAAIISLLFGGFLAACSDMSGKPLRVAINPWPGYAFLFLAQEKGYFTEEGVNVELVELSSLSDVRNAFERGQVDGMASSLVEVLEVSKNSDRRAVISVMADYSNGADVILANKQFADVVSLTGAKVGIEPGTLNRLILTRALEANGLSNGDIELVNIAQPSMQKALMDGEVDAVVTFPPVSTEIERLGNVRKVFSSAEIPGEIADVISFDAEVISRRRIEIEAFGRAWSRAVDFADEHPAEAYALMSPHTGMTSQELREVYETIHVVHGPSQAAFLEADGALSVVVRTLSKLLWPDDAPLSDAELADFFVSQEGSGSWAAAWN